MLAGFVGHDEPFDAAHCAAEPHPSAGVPVGALRGGAATVSRSCHVRARLRRWRELARCEQGSSLSSSSTYSYNQSDSIQNER